MGTPLYLTRAEVRAIDRRAIEEFGIPGIVLMENAARAATACAVEMLGEPAGKQVLILCGGGNNGGDGLAVARHLANAGARVQVAFTIDPARYSGDALINYRIVQAIRIPCGSANVEMIRRATPDLVIDAIFGSGLTSTPREPFAAIAQAVNATGAPLLAIDIPSGMDCDSGEIYGECIRAARTVTFVALKQAFANPASRVYTGDIVVGDIGAPRSLIAPAMFQAPSSE